MTDNEIVKALRAVAKKYEGKPIATFETNINAMATDVANHIERLCGEINRQKAEIEELKIKNEHLVCILAEARAEAIKEFAEMLKEHFEIYPDAEESNAIYVTNLIDAILKEITEGK